MKKLGFRLKRFTSESEVVAALSVQGGLVKNKMKGGPLNKMGKSYLAEQFRQIKLSLTEQWRFNKKKNTLREEVYYMVVYYRPLPSSYFDHSPCIVSAATTSDSEVSL